MDELEKQVWEKLVDKALEYVDEIIKPSLGEVGGMLADRVKLWRYKNQVDILLKAKEYQERKGISPKTIPVKTLVNLMEASSYEEDDNLKDRWAALLANATDTSNEFSLHSVFIDILKQLSPLEAEVLDFMLNEGRFHNGQRYDRAYSRHLLHEMHLRKEKSNPKKYKYGEMEKSLEPIIVENLVRLNLIEYEKPKIYDRNSRHSLGKTPEYTITEKENVQLTKLGLKFIEECSFK